MPGLLGQVLADLALIHLPYGGLYLIGGMARAMAPYLERFALADHFREARRVDLLLRQFSVTLVEDDNAALIGCAAALAEVRALTGASAPGYQHQPGLDVLAFTVTGIWAEHRPTPFFRRTVA